MDASHSNLERLAAEQLDLLVRIEAHAARTNELLHAMLNREQKHAFAVSSSNGAGVPVPM